MLRSFQNAYPDYSWYAFDPSTELRLSIESDVKSTQSKMLVKFANILTDDSDKENSTNVPFLNINGQDRKLRLPVKVGSETTILNPSNNEK